MVKMTVRSRMGHAVADKLVYNTTTAMRRCTSRSQKLLKKLESAA